MIVKHAGDLDKRVDWNVSHYDNMADLYEQVDCVVLPSRSEGWGLPHREAAMMGLPVIVQKYAGVDDGFTEKWALTVEGGRMETIPKSGRLGGSGNWMVADTDELADRMRSVYDYPERASRFGYEARNWLMAHQTWLDSAADLINLIHDEVGSDYGNKVQYPTISYDGTSSRRVLAHSPGVGQERS
jgi:glycosyltransferase involved in cell wall biosynthesis